MTQEAGSCVRLVQDLARGNFTLLHYADILRGGDVAKVKKLGHERNKYFGALKCMNRTNIERLLRRLVSEKYLTESIVVGQHGMVISYVKLGTKAQYLISGKQKMTLDVESNKKQETVHTAEKVDKTVNTCYEALIHCRKELARQRGLMVQNILTNNTLHEMSEVRPHTEADLRNITGVTELKSDFYGESFLAVLRKFPPGKKIESNDFVEDSAGKSKWISTRTSSSSSAVAVSTKQFDRYNYKNAQPASKSKTTSSPNISITPASASSTSNTRLMPLPVPKKAKLRRL